MNQTTTFADWSQFFDELDSLLHDARTSTSRLDDVHQWLAALDGGEVQGLTIRGTGKYINQCLELKGTECLAIGKALTSIECQIENTLRQQLGLLKERVASLL